MPKTLEGKRIAKIDIFEIKKELTVFLRNQDILSTSIRGVTTLTEEFNGTGAQTTFNLANSTVKNVRTTTVDTIAKSFGIDYTVNYEAATVTFLVAPPSGTDNVDITYDFGTTDKIFPDFPQAYLDVDQYPRIAVEIISGTTSEFALNADENRSEYIVTIVAYDNDQSDIEEMIADVRKAIIDNKKSFFNFTFITPTSMGPLIISPFGEGKIFQRNQDCRVMFVYEN